MRKIIIVCGYLASGKSTFAMQLSERFGLPCFLKDTFKVALSQHIALTTREERSRFSAVTFDGMVYAAERLMQHGYPLILEGNFMPAGFKETDEAGVLQAMILRYGYDALVLQFTGDTSILHTRFLARETTAGRGDANRIGEVVPLERFDRWCRKLDGFHLDSQTIQVDTSDFAKVDFDGLLSRVALFLHADDSHEI